MKGNLGASRSNKVWTTVAVVIVVGIILASLVLTASKPTNPSTATTSKATMTGTAPYVVVNIVEMANTTYTTTFTTTPQPHVLIVFQPNVLVVINASGTYTETSTTTYTTTTWS